MSIAICYLFVSHFNFLFSSERKLGKLFKNCVLLRSTIFFDLLVHDLLSLAGQATVYNFETKGNECLFVFNYFFNYFLCCQELSKNLLLF